MKKINNSSIDQQALLFHSQGQPGKVSLKPSKPLVTQRDLALAYSPGVAAPCLEIKKDINKIFDYTAKGNYVAVISNGTAVLGLGNLGASASKPVMEGKAVLFKKFADIDAVDIEIDTANAEEFINAVKYLGPSWGGINLEDIKAPECFIIESELKKIMNIPVFHDDQHGTAIVTAAGIINALKISNKNIEDVKIIANGAGSAGIACIELLKLMGARNENVILCDSNGVIYKGRNEGMNKWKAAHAVDTKKRTLAEAMTGADIFLGLSVKDAVTKEMVKSMAAKPIIFAMANPDPEITPDDAKEACEDAIIATGRSDYPNQVNNVLGFPYIFRGALDVHATTINEEMKIAAANAIAALARQHVPEEVKRAYDDRDLRFGPEYIIPTPFDPRLISEVPIAVAKAAIDSGVAKKVINNWGAYEKNLKSRRDPTVNSLSLIYDRLKANPKKIIFAEGEQEEIVRAAALWRDNGYGVPVLVGRKDRVEEAMNKMGIKNRENMIIQNAAICDENDKYINHLYNKLQRKGVLLSDCARMVKNDRNIFSASMLDCGDADAMITGLTRGYRKCLIDIWKVIKNKPDEIAFGISMAIAEGKTIFIADTAFLEIATSEQLVRIAIQSAKKVRDMGYEPRVAFVSYSNFGSALKEESSRIMKAVQMMDEITVDFEYDGEMTPDVALDMNKMSKFPFCRLSAPANILILPGMHSASISVKLLQTMGGCEVVGPILTGLQKSVQIVSMKSSVSEILNMAAIAAMSD